MLKASGRPKEAGVGGKLQMTTFNLRCAAITLLNIIPLKFRPLTPVHSRLARKAGISSKTKMWELARF